MSQQSTTEMGWCRVVGPRGLCRPLDEKQATNKHLSGLLDVLTQGRAGQGRAGQGRAGQGRAGRGGAGRGGAGRGRARAPQQARGFGVHLYCLTERPFAMVSGALGSLGFRV